MRRTAFKRKNQLWNRKGVPQFGAKRGLRGTKKKKTKKHTVPHSKLLKRAKNKLREVSHTHIRKRDSVNEEIAGYCCTCGKFCEGSNFQAGHWWPDSTGGALLRYHPHNMHGQGGYCCNINRNHQQKMGNDYTLWMIKKYGQEYIDKLRAMKKKDIQADLFFYETLTALYEEGDEEKIIFYLESF